MKNRHTVIPAVHLFLIKNDQVLLQRRYNTGYEDGNYSVPSGHVDGGETVTAAAIREALEETGVKLDPADLEMVHVMHRTKPNETEERVDFFFKVANWQGEPEIMEPNKCDQLHWCHHQKLPGNVIPYVQFALEKMLAHTKYSEFGW